MLLPLRTQENRTHFGNRFAMRAPLFLLPILLGAALLGCSRSDGENAALRSMGAIGPRFAGVVVTDDKLSKKPRETFGTDSPEVIVAFNLENVPEGAEAKSSWVAEKCVGAPENYEIDSVTLRTGLASNSGSFSLSRPDKGWPKGQYRVDLFLEGKKSASARFRVE